MIHLLLYKDNFYACMQRNCHGRDMRMTGISTSDPPVPTLHQRIQWEDWEILGKDLCMSRSRSHQRGRRKGSMRFPVRIAGWRTLGRQLEPWWRDWRSTRTLYGRETQRMALQFMQVNTTLHVMSWESATVLGKEQQRGRWKWRKPFT